ncbi:MAG: RimK/LysX family protein [Ottowia sp.]|nr:RimK/LysX family protein [Ottowia sp.]
MRAGFLRHQLPTALALLAGTTLLAACSNDYAWVRKDNMDWAQRYVETQHAEKQDLMAQQEQFAMILARLNETLARNAQLEQAISQLSQVLARPLRLEAPILQVAAAATPSRNIESSSSDQAAVDSKKMLVGSVETAWFPQLDRQIESRIDTGAKSSSINVADYEIIERDGEKWVRFSLDDADDEEDDGDAGNKAKVKAKDDAEDDAEESNANKKNRADRKTFESKLVRRVKILQSSTEEKDRRPVISLRVVIGNVAQEAEFTLADRDHLSYDALIGRNALRDLMIVDVSRDHVTRVPDELKD